MEQCSDSPADLGKLIAEETEKWGKVVRFAGIKPGIGRHAIRWRVPISNSAGVRETQKCDHGPPNLKFTPARAMTPSCLKVAGKVSDPLANTIVRFSSS